MCGIAGIIGSSNVDQREDTVKKMIDTLVHRGPDDAGFFSNEHISTGMRRLAIIDLVSGKQPIFDASREYGVVFNGEIYNYLEIKKELEKEGIKFRTNSDTEAIIHLYKKYNEDCPKYMKGMFTFCVFHTQRKEFFFARDRFGEKPLFYHFDNENLSFSSELKSLLQNSTIPKKLNIDALSYFLKVSFVPEPSTLFMNILTLPPGYFMKFDGLNLVTKPYFNINYTQRELIDSEDEAAEYIRPFLKTAIDRQKRSDVPLGAFLSGGIDSSTVAAILQQGHTEKIKTFNVKFDDADYDESPIARRVAEYCGTEHHEIVIPNKQFHEDIFWSIVDHVGTPFPDSSAIPTYFITKEIRNEVTVALSGDGGDELFGGYEMFGWGLKINTLEKTPEWLRKVSLKSIKFINNDLKLFSGSNYTRQVGKALEFFLEGPK